MYTSGREMETANMDADCVEGGKEAENGTGKRKMSARAIMDLVGIPGRDKSQ